MAGVMDQIAGFSQDIGFANIRVVLKMFLFRVADKIPVAETNIWVLHADLSEGNTGNMTTDFISLSNEWLDDNWLQGLLPEKEHRKMSQGQSSVPTFYVGFRKFELYHDASEFYDNFSASIYRVSSLSLNPQQMTIDTHELRTLSFIIHQGGFNDKTLMRSDKKPLHTQMKYIKALFNEHVTSSKIELSRTASLLMPAWNKFLPTILKYRRYLVALLYPLKPGKFHQEPFFKLLLLLMG